MHRGKEKQNVKGKKQKGNDVNSEVNGGIKYYEKRVETEKHQNFLFPFSFSHFPSYCPAMTLAEVLITLGIIGVVAALTIPNLIGSYQKQATVARLKEDYSLLNQAFVKSAADNGTTFSSLFAHDTLPIGQSPEAVITDFVQSNIIPYLAVTKDCGYVTYSVCKMEQRKNLAGVSTGDLKNYKLFLKNGSALTVTLDNNGINWTNVMMTLDINGNQKPNTFGKDAFLINLNSTSNKLVFFGSGSDRNTLLNHAGHGCKIGATGYYCGALIMIDGWQIGEGYPW